jgi:hypothetical protein
MPAIDAILNDLQRTQQPATTKTASAAAHAVSPVAQAAAELTSSLASFDDLTKQASAPPAAPQTPASAIDAVQKMAQDLADADDQQRIKQAQLYGAAVFDGFVSRANQYAEYAPGTKVAQAQTPQTNEYAVKLASHLGYAEAEVAINRLVTAEKTAQAQPRGTVTDGIEAAMEKIAHDVDDCFRRGFQQMESLAAAMQANG